MKFTWKMDETLVQAVKKRKCIYDPRDKNFKNCGFKYQYWEEIRGILGVSHQECKKRWKSLRDQYGKKRKIPSGKWQLSPERDYMQLLSFLSDTAQKQDTCTEMSEDDSNNSQLGEQIIKLENNDSTDEEEREGITYQDLQDDSSNSEEISATKKKRNSAEAYFQDPLAKMIATDSQRAVPYDNMGNQTPKNAMQKFFESMADVADKLPPHLQAEIRLKVCQIVTETELKHHKQGSFK